MCLNMFYMVFLHFFHLLVVAIGWRLSMDNNKIIRIIILFPKGVLFLIWSIDFTYLYVELLQMR